MDQPPLIEPEVAPPKAELRFALAIGPGQASFVLPLGLHAEVWPKPRYSPLPGTTAWMAGLVNLRGTLAPVYELAGSLGLPGPPNASARVLILGEGEERVGLIVYGDPRPLSLVPLAGESATPPANLAPYAGAGWRAENGETLWELNLAAWSGFVRTASALGGNESVSATEAAF